MPLESNQLALAISKLDERLRPCAMEKALVAVSSNHPDIDPGVMSGPKT